MNKNGLLIVTTKQNKMCGPWFFLQVKYETWIGFGLQTPDVNVVKCWLTRLKTSFSEVILTVLWTPLLSKEVKIFFREDQWLPLLNIYNQNWMFTISGALKIQQRVAILGASLNLSRLDYWLTSNSLSDNVSSVYIIPSIKTDHSMIEFQDLGDKAKGPGIWKFNCSLLSDNLYVEQINSLIRT